jgi:hypothetical protein
LHRVVRLLLYVRRIASSYRGYSSIESRHSYRYHRILHLKLHMLGHSIPATISAGSILAQNWFEFLLLFAHVPPYLFQTFSVNSYFAPSGDTL